MSWEVALEVEELVFAIGPPVDETGVVELSLTFINISHSLATSYLFSPCQEQSGKLSIMLLSNAVEYGLAQSDSFRVQHS